MVCFDEIFTGDCVKTSSAHQFCKDCFSGCVETSIELGNAFPPTCRGIAISFTAVVNNVSSEVFRRYQARQQLEKAAGLYCAQPACAIRIPDENIDGALGKCPICREYTCTQCRAAVLNELSESHVCRIDSEREAILAMAKAKDWYSYYHSGEMVSKHFGCNRMVYVLRENSVLLPFIR